MVPCSLLSLNIHRVFFAPGVAKGGLWGKEVEDVLCMYCICHCLDEWHGVVWVVFPPLWLILCVLFPLCCTIRTLQWDTDPSVLQLQSDSELGYMSALLLLLFLFICYSCVGMLELLLLLFYPPFCWTSSLINLFSSVSFPYKVNLLRKPLFVENTTKRWLLVSPLWLLLLQISTPP